MTKKEKIIKINNEVKRFYIKHKNELPFHGWHHICFVKKKAIEFSKSIKGDSFIVETAALLHDINYLSKNYSHPKKATILREKLLKKNGYSKDEINKIETTILESHTADRNCNISKEGKALSDADTLFKALPVVPILFTNSFLKQTNVNLLYLADEIIVKPQNKLMKSGIYFYTKLAKQKYMHWAKTNLELWNNIKDALNDKDVKEMLSIAKNNNVI